MRTAIYGAISSTTALGGGISPGVPDIGTVTWATPASDTTPGFSFDLPVGVVAGDELYSEKSADGAGVYTEYFRHTITAQDIIDDAITVYGVVALAEGAYDFRFRLERGVEIGDWSAIVDVTINLAPTISTLNPADNATGVAVTADLVATFNKNVQFGTGTIRLYDSDNDLIESFNVETEVGTGPGQVSIAGAVLTINPAASMEAGKGHYVQIDATAIENLNDIAFAGIANTTTWNFTTEAAGAWQTVFDETADFASGVDDNGYNGYTIVIVIPIASFLATGGTKIRLTLVAGSTEGFITSGAWTGNGGGGNAYDFTGDQVQLKQSASNTITVGAGASAVTDEANFVKDGSNNLVVAIQFQNSAADNVKRIAAASSPVGFGNYDKNAIDAATQDKSGYADTAILGLHIVSKVELFI